MRVPARRTPGSNAAIVTFRRSLEALLESLDATARIARWESGAEPVPEALRQNAALLQQRLASANRLAAGRFVGAADMVATSDAIRTAVQQLDAAFVAYRKRTESGSGEQHGAALELEAELERIKRDASQYG